MKKSRGLLVTAVTVLALVAVSLLAACGSSTKADVSAAVKGDGDLSQYAKALDAAGLSSTLTGKGPFTVFAATNDALTKAGVTLSADSVKASVVEGTTLAKADMVKGTKNDSLLAKTSVVTYTGTDGSLYVNTYKLAGDPIKAGNGIVYPIAGVIQAQ
jgi:uncharacterized surface protein with fasciclin (FAS1) repeats